MLAVSYPRLVSLTECPFDERYFLVFFVFFVIYLFRKTCFRKSAQVICVGNAHFGKRMGNAHLGIFANRQFRKRRLPSEVQIERYLGLETHIQHSMMRDAISQTNQTHTHTLVVCELFVICFFHESLFEFGCALSLDVCECSQVFGCTTTPHNTPGCSVDNHRYNQRHTTSHNNTDPHAPSTDTSQHALHTA